MGKQNKTKTGGAVEKVRKPFDTGSGPSGGGGKKGLADKRDALRVKSSCADHALKHVSKLFEPLSSFENVLKDANAAIVLVKALRRHDAARKLRKIERLLGDLVFSEPLRDRPGMRESQLSELNSLAERRATKVGIKLQKAERKQQLARAEMKATQPPATNEG